MRLFIFLMLIPNLWAQTADEVCPLKPGQMAPEATLHTTKGQPIPFSDVLGGKPTVLVVYRGSWCPFCNKQMAGLRDTVEPIQSAGFQLIAVSPDRPEILAQRPAEEAAFPLFSDQDMSLANALGIAFQLDAATLEKYKGYNIDLEAASGRNHHMLPVPSVYVFDAQGRAIFGFSNPDYRVRLEPSVLLAVLAAHKAAGQ
ncbi:MAG: AhpC/TSA family protein [Acidobacteria bacterium]|nr:AhpC/TSA family protein [Acidobacteriota bacterium]